MLVLVFVPASPGEAGLKIFKQFLGKERKNMVALYTKPRCVQCDATKRKMNQLGLKYEEISLVENPDQLEYVLSKGMTSAPVVEFPNGEMFCGFRPDRIIAYHKSTVLA